VAALKKKKRKEKKETHVLRMGFGLLATFGSVCAN
jgi:hypothetical protein